MPFLKFFALSFKILCKIFAKYKNPPYICVNKSSGRKYRLLIIVKAKALAAAYYSTTKTFFIMKNTSEMLSNLQMEELKLIDLEHKEFLLWEEKQQTFNKVVNIKAQIKWAKENEKKESELMAEIEQVVNDYLKEAYRVSVILHETSAQIGHISKEITVQSNVCGPSCLMKYAPMQGTKLNYPPWVGFLGFINPKYTAQDGWEALLKGTKLQKILREKLSFEVSVIHYTEALRDITKEAVNKAALLFIEPRLGGNPMNGKFNIKTQTKYTGVRTTSIEFCK